MRQLLFITGALVAVYLLVSNATGAGRLINAGAGAYAQGVRTLQGR